MKLSVGKRIVLFVHWLLSFAACLAVMFFCLAPDTIQKGVDFINTSLGTQLAGIAGLVLLVIYGLFAILSLAFILNVGKKDDDSGFITVISDDTGKTRIAVGAIDQMIRIAVRGVAGIADLKTSIVNETDAISISVSITAASGAHIPTITSNIQRTVSSYIELNCGVSVREVCVSVNALENPDESGKRGRKKFGKAVMDSAAVPAAIEEVQQKPVKLEDIQVIEQDIVNDAVEEAEIIEDETVIDGEKA